MEENTNMNNENQNEAAVVDKKLTFKEKVQLKKDEIAAKRTVKKAEKAAKPKCDKKKIALGIGAGVLLVGSAIAAAAVRSRAGSDEVYDPDYECEPGDDYEVMNEEESVEEETPAEEVVNEE